jgi:hypothetical protein
MVEAVGFLERKEIVSGFGEDACFLDRFWMFKFLR